MSSVARSSSLSSRSVARASCSSFLGACCRLVRKAGPVRAEDGTNFAAKCKISGPDGVFISRGSRKSACVGGWYAATRNPTAAALQVLLPQPPERSRRRERETALLARGRRFAVARRAGEIVRLAILRIGRGRRDDVRGKVAEGRRLLKSYLGRN